MPVTEVKAKLGKGKDAPFVTIKYDMGKDIADMVSRSSKDGADGNAIVFSEARAARVIKLQDLIRAGIKDKKSAAEIQKEANAFSPGIKKRGRSKAEKLRDDFTQLSPEEKKELLGELTG